MKRNLVIVIDTDGNNCSKKVGTEFVLCDRMRTTRFGLKWCCGLFGMQELSDQYGVPSGEGTLQRLPECVNAEKRPLCIKEKIKW